MYVYTYIHDTCIIVCIYLYIVIHLYIFNTINRTQHYKQDANRKHCAEKALVWE